MPAYNLDNAMSDKILVVEDEDDLRELLVFNLEREGFLVLQAADGHSAVATALAEQPDLILLDVMLPGLDGFSVCRELRKNKSCAETPVIMLTARGDEMDRVVGLELGADDYVVKPFSIRELLLRVRAVLRRAGQPAGHATEEISLHGLVLSSSSHQVSLGSKSIELTATEFRLLEDLMRHAGTVRRREQLLDAVWGYSFEGYGRTVDTHIRRLRSKLGQAGDYIETIRGVGYRFKHKDKEGKAGDFHKP